MLKNTRCIEVCSNLEVSSLDTGDLSNLDIDKDMAEHLTSLLANNENIRTILFKNTKLSLEALDVFLMFLDKHKHIIKIKFMGNQFNLQKQRKVAIILGIIRDNHIAHNKLTNAAFNGYYEVVEKLLSAGMHYDGMHYPGAPHKTPLYLALTQGHKNIAKLLLLKHIKLKNHNHTLDLSRNRVKPEMIEPLMEIFLENFNNNIDYLDLSYNDFNDFRKVRAIIENLKDVASLTELNLSNCYINMDGALEISKVFEFIPSLGVLNLASNHISDIGFDAIVTARLSQGIRCKTILHIGQNYLSNSSSSLYLLENAHRHNDYIKSSSSENKITSVVTASMTFTRESWLITIARKFVHTNKTTDIQHAFLLLEGMDKFGQIFLRQYDFRPMRSVACDSKYIPIKIGMKGVIRSKDFSPSHLQSEISNYAYLVVSLNKKNVRKIVNSIEEDRLNPPEFQTLGSNFLKGYNCFTWCLAKLEVGGVNTKEIVNNPLFTRTSDYIPPSSTNEQPNFSYCSLM